MKALLFLLLVVVGVFTPIARAQEEKKAANPPVSQTSNPSSTSQAPERRMPQSGPEMQRLISALEGSWSITEKYDPDTRTPNGGVNHGEEVWRPGPGGRSLVEDYHSKTPADEVFGLSVTWWEQNAHGYRAIWCANNLPTGCMCHGEIGPVGRRPICAWRRI